MDDWAAWPRRVHGRYYAEWLDQVRPPPGARRVCRGPADLDELGIRG